MMAAIIHPTAIIEEGAHIEKDARIGPFSIIGKGVKIGSGVSLMSNVIVEGETEIGDGCTIYPFASIGLPPQDLKYKGEKTGLKIGENTIIREYATIHRGSVGGDGMTEVGSGNFLMAYTHIAHDCKVGNSIIMANAATLAGHVTVEDFVVISGLAAVHQHTRIGAYSMIGGLSAIRQDIPPYVIASGERAKLFGLNLVGLKRRGFSDATINELKKAYKMLFRDKLTLNEAIKKVQEELPYTEEIKRLLDFIKKNKRGICR